MGRINQDTGMGRAIMDVIETATLAAAINAAAINAVRAVLRDVMVMSLSGIGSSATTGSAGT
jgi:hypothetical protein